MEKTGLEKAIQWCIENAFNIEGQDGTKYVAIDYEDLRTNFDKWKLADASPLNNTEELTIEEITNIAFDHGYGIDINSDKITNAEHIAYCAGLRKGSEIMRAKSLPVTGDKDGWVSVEERLPENEGWYLVCINGKIYSKEYTYFYDALTQERVYNNSEGAGTFLHGHTLPVTHWMPLPNSPK